MRLLFAWTLCLLTAGVAQATPPFSVDELPLPFGGEIDHLRFSDNGMVVGCMERGPGDWLPFAWNPAHGLQLIDGGSVGDRYRCSIAGVSDDGLVAGYLPRSTSWPHSVPFVWSHARGLTLFDDGFYPAMLFNSAGQLVLRDVFRYRLVVWTESEGRIEVDLGERDIVSFRQNDAGQVAGVLEFPIPMRRFFVWSRERGLETFLEHTDEYQMEAPTIERLSEDGWVAGHLPDPSTDSWGNLAYVRAPDGTIHTFSLGRFGIDLYEFGHDGLIVGQAYDARKISVAFVFQPGFGMEVLSFTPSPYTYMDSANDVNASNVVSGRATEGYYSYAFVWERGKGIERIGLGGRSSSGGLINDQGWVVGSGFNRQNQYHPFLWSRRTGAIELSWGNEGGYGTWVTGFNATGTVVGRGVDRPFVFMPRVGLLDPREWLPPLAAGSLYPYRLKDTGKLLIRGNAIDDGRWRYFVVSLVPPKTDSVDVGAAVASTDP